MLLSTQLYKWIALNLILGVTRAMDWHLVHAVWTTIYLRL